METENTFKELIKTNSFGKKKSSITIENKILTYNNKTINLDDVVEVKYGLHPYQIYHIYVGWQYLIDLKTKEENVKIELQSFFKFSVPYFNELFNKIINTIWESTVTRIVNKSIDDIISGNEIQIGKCKLSNKGININNFLIEWEDLSYQKNYDRLTINSRSNEKIWTNLYYLDLYNVDVALNICDWVFKFDGLNELKKQRITNEQECQS